MNTFVIFAVFIVSVLIIQRRCRGAQLRVFGVQAKATRDGVSLPREKFDGMPLTYNN